MKVLNDKEISECLGFWFHHFVDLKKSVGCYYLWDCKTLNGIQVRTGAEAQGTYYNRETASRLYVVEDHHHHPRKQPDPSKWDYREGSVFLVKAKPTTLNDSDYLVFPEHLGWAMLFSHEEKDTGIGPFFYDRDPQGSIEQNFRKKKEEIEKAKAKGWI
ncbi:MAG: hypothetical protein HRT45_00790 [Bdellovibrionales bacterium]|nr:hypothetical protein [Bdellovibrionales bacterium]